MGKNWPSIVWWTYRTNSLNAQDCGGTKKMAKRSPIFKRPEFLYAPTWPRGNATGHLCRLAFTRLAGGNDSRSVVYHTWSSCGVSARHDLRIFWQYLLG